MQNPISRYNQLPLRAQIARLAALFVLVAGCALRAAAPAAAVVAVQPTRVADLVLLNSGFEAGLRQGMVCRISRGSTEIAEVVLVDLRRTCSSALILSVATGQAIRSGDFAAIKVLKS